jgi:hypothetical protein
MYDHDLRLWYRDLFLPSACRRATAKARARAAVNWERPLPKADPAAIASAFEMSRDHERPQATH